MIYFFGALLLALHILPLVRGDFDGFKRLGFRSLVIGGGLLFIITPLVSLLIWRKALYYGGREGIYQDTVLSLTKYSFYSLELTLVHTIASIAFLSLFVLVSIYSIVGRQGVFSPRGFMLFISFCIGLGLIVSHHALGVLYPIDRVALFLYPIVILAFFLCLGTLRRWIVVCVSSILVCISSVIFILNANFYKTIRWWFDSRTEVILNAVNKQGEGRGEAVNVGFDSELTPSMRYYLRKNKYTFVYSVSHDESLAFSEVDYYVHVSERPDLEKSSQLNRDKVKETLSRYSKSVFLEYPDDGIIVYCELSEH